MFLSMSIVFPYFDRQKRTWKTLLLALIIWTIEGVGFSYTIKLIRNNTMNKKRENTDTEI